ncbi:Pumilio y domain member 6 [Coemansia javaensis]|uniref:Pumilio y domain member 6 n=1 Tax=Coemansia javaensis TaxID=2761396 RepID=A0A9W8HHE0_9FUNG|nr:Pumilio y domain member 6 [Coemansia javaensis]
MAAMKKSAKTAAGAAAGSGGGGGGGGGGKRRMFENRKDKYNKAKRDEAKRKMRAAKGASETKQGAKGASETKQGATGAKATDNDNRKRKGAATAPAAETAGPAKRPKSGMDELKAQARKAWEVLRRGDLGVEERAQRMDEMMGLLGGRIKEVTFKHDMSRVVQTCLKYGSDAQREAIAGELAGTYVELSRSMYGRHILLRLLKYCPRQRGAIMAAFHGQVRRLIRHKEAAAVLEECFAVYANAQQRWDLVGEFYGNEFAVFKGTARSIDAVLEQAPQKRVTVVAALKAAVTPLLEKGTVQHSIVHRALLDYMRHADDAGRQAAVEAMRELVVEVLHTRDGAHVGMLCLLHGTAKDRKAIVRTFKPYLRRICCEEYGHAVLIEALDSMDDTVFLNKAVLQDLGALAPELLADQFGRRTLLYILGGRNPHYLGIDALHVLAAGDAVRAATSKKDPTVRRRELVAHISPAMVAWVEAHAAAAIVDALPSQAVSETLLRAHGDKARAWAAVLALVRADVAALGDAHVLLHPIANRVVTNCILAEHAPPRSADPTLPPLPETNPRFGSDVLAALAESAQLAPAACAGAFPVRALLESPVTGARARELLRPHRAAIAAAPKQTRVHEAILRGLDDGE